VSRNETRGKRPILMLEEGDVCNPQAAERSVNKRLSLESTEM